MSLRLEITYAYFAILLTATCICARRVLNSFAPKKHEPFDSFSYEDIGLNLSESLHGRRLASSSDHRVKTLPGLNPRLDIVHYAGHITVDEAKGGNLFYWLIEAQKVDPATG